MGAGYAFVREKMSQSSMAEGAAPVAGRDDLSPLRRAIPVLRRLLPPGAVVAAGWRDPLLGSQRVVEPAGVPGPGLHLDLLLLQAGPLEHVPGQVCRCWQGRSGQSRLGLVVRLPATDAQDLDEARLEAAQAVLESALEEARAQAWVSALERSRRLQQALFDIAELADAEVEMGQMLHRLHAIIGTLMYAPNCFIVEYDDVADTVRFLYFADQADPYVADPERAWTEAEMPNSITFALLRHGRPLRGPASLVRQRLGLSYSPDQGPDSLDWLGVPMRRGGRVCGAIVVQSYDRADCYSDEDRALLGYVAQHVLTTLDRRQAQAELERRVAERTLELERANRELQEEVLERERAEKLQHALFRIAEMAMSSETVEQYYAKVHAAVDDLIYARNFYIALRQPGDMIEFVYSVDEHGGPRPPRRFGNGLTEYVMSRGEALLARREDIERLTAEGKVTEHGKPSSCWLGVPLYRDGEVVGVIAVQSYDPAIGFTVHDQRLLAFVAHNIGNGLARQEAQERLKAAHAELERRVAERTAALEEANRQLLAQIGERLRAEQRLTHQALHDALTGLPNRSYLLDRMATAIERARDGGGEPFAVLFLDLDRFKLVNDSIGHAAGDELLVEVARRIVATIDPGDMVARLGGDEFAILVNREHRRGHAEPTCELAQRLLVALGQPLWVGGRELFPSASMGIAVWHPRYRSGEEMLRDADAAMYRAKHQGRGRYAIFDEDMREQATRTLDLEADLRRAINRREFLPYYQPILRLEDGVVVGHEALLRWRHERRGLLAPAAFIGLGEESGLIEEVDWLLYNQVIEELARGGQGYISVNVSPRHFRSADFADRLLGQMEAAGADPSQLRVEITEVALLEDAPRTLRLLNTLREHGVLVQLDDFGTGFSALSYLHRFPISGLKIDRSFVAGLAGEGGRHESLALVRAILALAGTLGIETVGEGIETAEQRRILMELGCAHGQGYLLGRPAARRRA